MERVYTFLEDRMFLYKCININCKDTSRTPGWSQWINCESCGAKSLPVEVLYRCLKCGSLDAFAATHVQQQTSTEASRTGTSARGSCRKCGFRIFIKPRRSGTDPENEGEGAFKMVKAD